MTRVDHIRAILKKAYAMLENFSGIASASFSSTSGGSFSKSFTSVKDLTAFISHWESELAKATSAVSAPDGFSVNYARWC